MFLPVFERAVRVGSVLGFGARRRAGVVSFVFVSASLSPSVALGKKGKSSLAVRTPADPRQLIVLLKGVLETLLTYL